MPRRRAAMAAGGAAALGAAALLLPHASASQEGGATTAGTARTLRATDASGLDARLRRTLGDAVTGTYYDSGTRRLVVGVADGDAGAAARARRAGAVVHQVANSTAELRAATRTLRTRAALPGTAWAVDPRTDKVVVTADSTVTGARWDRLRSTVRGLGSGMATLKKSPGTLRTLVSGGDAVLARTPGGGVRCSLGFNVTAADGAPAFLTAGHCGVAAEEWSDSLAGRPIATVDRVTFPGEGDFSLVTYDDPATAAPSEVDVGDGRSVRINRAADATVGETVFRTGSTTGLHDGRVTGLDATVNFRSESDPGGVDTVTGLIRTDVCAEAGDSGGSLFTGDGGAVGLTSGGSGDCTSGGETFFQPVTTALAATGATLGDGGADTGGQPGAGDDRAGGDRIGDTAAPSAPTADPGGTGADPGAGSSLTGTR